ncbi:MAG: hypothetical protein LBJ62_00630 [Bifidobacteriaceae bacterium]|nr:hypothetical protein [Bifidobacteriaceae bacterium]
MTLWRLGLVAAGLVVGLVAAYCLVVAGLGAAAERAYQAGDWVSAEARYRLAARLMPFERWKPLFGMGTTVLAGGEAERAETVLTGTLEVTPATWQCTVRANLSLAQETQGDTAAVAGLVADAAEFYQEASETLRQGGCVDQLEAASQAIERLDGKTAALDEPSGGRDGDDPSDPDESTDEDDPSNPAPPGNNGSPPDGAPDEASQTERALEELRQRNLEADRERAENREEAQSERQRQPGGPGQNGPIW